MKRVLSFDFLRGVAIVGVLLFHVFNIAFEQRIDEIRGALDSGSALDFQWYIIAPVLIVLGSFNGMFLMISAASNAISVHKQWTRQLEKGSSKDDAFKRIMKSQTIRGVIIWFFGYLSEHVFANLLTQLLAVYGESTDPILESMVDGIFFWNILNTIGISLILSSLIQLLYLKKGWSRKAMSMFLLILTFVIIAIEPAVNQGVRDLFGSDNLSSGIETATAWDVILRLIIVPFAGRLTPLVPFFSCATIGLLFSININDHAITPEFLQKMLWLGVIFVCASTPVGAIFGFSFGDREREIFFQMFIIGFEIMSVTYLLYMVDFRKKTKVEIFAKNTVWIRRFGIMTLTLWMLQYLMIFPNMLLELITGWPIIGMAPGVDNGGLNDWQIWIVLGVMFFMWHAILILWEKVQFKGSFEWMTTYLMSGRSTSGDRMNLDSVLYKTERMIEWVPSKKKRNLAQSIAEST